MNKLDRLSASGLWHQNMLSVASYLAGGNLKGLPTRTYWRTHLIVDSIYLILLVIPLTSLFRLRRFRRQMTLGQGRRKHTIFFILLHLLLPALVWFAPPILSGTPRDLFSMAFPDSYMVMLTVIGLSVLGGLAKVYLWLRQKQQGQSH